MFFIIIVALVSESLTILPFEFAHRGHRNELHTSLDFFRGVGFLLSYWFFVFVLNGSPIFVFVGVLGLCFRGEKNQRVSL